VILAGPRRPEYADAIRAERARRASDAEQPGSAATDRKADPAEQGDTVPDDSGDQPTSAVDIAPRPPSD
jgi:hypothetical protein